MGGRDFDLIGCTFACGGTHVGHTEYRNDYPEIRYDSSGMRNERTSEFQTPRLFGTSTRTLTLMLIAMLDETHAGEIARLLGRSPSRIKEAVDRLESEGVIVGYAEGSAKRLRLNPRYLAADELGALLTKLGSQDHLLQARLATLRRRPRKAGKEI